MKSVTYHYQFHETPLTLDGNTLTCPECAGDKLVLQNTFSYHRKDNKKSVIRFIDGPLQGIPEKDLNELCSTNPSNSGDAVVQHILCRSCGKIQRLAMYSIENNINVRWMDRFIPSKW